jgi:predicted GIY-YIG superfamily endonuclease
LPMAHRRAPRGRRAFCCYILQSERWSTPYTGKTCNLTQRLHRHNHPSKRSRAYTKGKGPWRVAAAVFGMRSNRQGVWLERALKRHAKHRARPAGLTAVQSAVLNAVRVSSRPSLWWRGANADQPAPTLHVHVFRCALSDLPEQLLLDALPASTTTQGAARISCHHQRGFPHRTTTAAG